MLRQDISFCIKEKMTVSQDKCFQGARRWKLPHRKDFRQTKHLKWMCNRPQDISYKLHFAHSGHCTGEFFFSPAPDMPQDEKKGCLFPPSPTPLLPLHAGPEGKGQLILSTSRQSRDTWKPECVLACRQASGSRQDHRGRQGDREARTGNYPLGSARKSPQQADL